MKKILALAIAGIAVGATAQRSETTLNEGWQFSKGTLAEPSGWQSVRVPHDWAIYGPFDRANDLQTVAVVQNGEKEERPAVPAACHLSAKACTRLPSKCPILPAAT